MSENAYLKLLRYLLPSEFEENFDLIDVVEEQRGEELLLHLYLDERELQPDGYTDLLPNGFYPESCINDSRHGGYVLSAVSEYQGL